MRSTLKNTLAVLPMAWPLVSVAAQEYDAPTYSGYTQIWADSFSGSSGDLPSTSSWNIVTGYSGVNDEMEEYTDSNENLQLSGGSTLQMIPMEDSSTEYGWTSARIESTGSWTPQDGVVTRVEAEISFGTDDISTKEGLWPAFWMLPESFRTGAQTWPDCGELDILETVDGILTGYGTVHCGDQCDDSDDAGLAEDIIIPDQSWHTWRLEWDRTSGDWATETIEWSMDDQVYHTITGSDFTEDTWDNLAHQPYYIILNLAVGGSWPGDPNSATVDGYGAMFEIGYVAVYET